MCLGSLGVQRRGVAEQQAIVRRPLEQAEEVLGRPGRLLDTQQAMLVDALQQCLHLAQHAQRAGFEEDLAELGVLGAQGHDQAAELDRLIAVDQRLEAAPDVQQDLLHRRAFGQFEEQFGQLGRAGGHDRRGEQCLLVVEVA
uniref:Secreted protein n=1 Tax=Steinernema glaseri TaxID=37863 RepID=A0A1I8AAZ9_9BILA